MASLQKESTGIYHVTIRHNGERFKKSLRTKSGPKAQLELEDIEATVELIKRGRLQVPEGVNFVDFVLLKGNVANLPKPEQPEINYAAPLSDIVRDFFADIPADSIEKNSLKTMSTHSKHLLRICGGNFDLRDLKLEHLQRYVTTRSKEPTQYFAKTQVDGDKPTRRLVAAATIRKEVVTLGSIFRWAESRSRIVGTFPNRGLRYPKSDEKPPFQTYDEIERKIELDGLDEFESSELWDALYLRKTEIQDLLAHVALSHPFPVVYPMIVCAAHTGARRSELIRARVSDFDFGTKTFTVREKKRDSTQRTTRQVPMSGMLTTVMQNWFAGHPGGRIAFCSIEGSEISPDQAHEYFKHAVAKSKWDRIRGWHCLRHTFISNLACAGIDQRLIDSFVGHSTDSMRRRYRHLFPDVKQAALISVFDAAPS